MDTSSPCTIDEAARRRFEAAWLEGRPASIDENLPSSDDPRYLPTLAELVLIDLEFAWKATEGVTKTGGPGPKPRLIEHYLDRYPALRSMGVLVSLLREEALLRRRFGDRPSEEEYRRRFPEVTTAGLLVETLPESRERPMRDRPPVADGYEVLGEVGRGGMGVVYEAREARLGRVVALKTSQFASSPAGDEARARFLAEARVAARLEHPGVVPVHELVVPPIGEPFYTMKLVRGRSLAEAVREFHTAPGDPGEQAVRLRRLLDAFLAVVRTMAFAHDRHVIHRDLKPANIVLGDYGETVILDWGLAKVLRGDSLAPEAATGPAEGAAAPDLTAQGNILGTPAYMPPEQAAGQTDAVDERSDVYALGGVLFHILTGKHPHGHTASGFPQLVPGYQPERPSAGGRRVHRALEAICLAALAPRKEDRYPTAKALAADVERFLAGEPVSVCPERLQERFFRWARRNRTLVATGTVAIVLVVIGAAVTINLVNQADRDRREQAKEYFNTQQRERQRLAFEEERRQTQERLEKSEAARRAAQDELARGLLELKTGRFHQAESAFRNGLAAIPAGIDLDLRPRMDRLHLAANRLATFHRYWELSERIALGTELEGTRLADDYVILACETGLRSLGALDGPADWWNHLPDEDLEPAQRHRLKAAAASSLGLLALWRTKRAIGELKDREASRRDVLAAIELAGRIKGLQEAAAPRAPGAAEPSTPTIDVLIFVCRILLAEDNPPPPRLPLVATEPTDMYYLGVTHFFLTMLKGSPFEWLVNSSSFKKKCGLDFATPLVTAERYLRDAVALDPGHYLAHYWLGRCLMQTRNFPASEQVYNTCITLRPTYVPGYVWRALSLVVETDTMPQAKPPRQRAELLALALRGLALAPVPVRGDPEIRWVEAICTAKQGRYAEAMVVATEAAEWEVTQRYGIASGLPSVGQRIVNILEQLETARPVPLETHANLAVAYLSAGRPAAARGQAAWVLAYSPRHPRALAIRGIDRLQSGAAAEALRDFEQALAVNPKYGLALIGRGWALEALGDSAGALAVYTSLLPPGLIEKGPQHLQPYLGRARVLARMGRSDEARAALEAGREIDPLATDILADRLFPRPPTRP